MNHGNLFFVLRSALLGGCLGSLFNLWRTCNYGLLCRLGLCYLLMMLLRPILVSLNHFQLLCELVGGRLDHARLHLQGRALTGAQR